MKAIKKRIKEFFIRMSIKHLGLIPAIDYRFISKEDMRNYQIILKKNNDLITNIDTKKIFDIQELSIYNYNFIRGKNKYTLTIERIPYYE